MLRSITSLFLLFTTYSLFGQIPPPPKIDVETLFFGLSSKTPEMIKFVNGMEDRRIWNYEPNILKDFPDSIKNPEKIRFVSLNYTSVSDLQQAFWDLTALPNLEYVEIKTATQFRKEDIKKEFLLPEDLSVIKNIRFLKIGGSFKIDFQQLFNRLQQFENLEYLGLGHHLENVVLPENFTALENLRGLKFLGFKGLIFPSDLSGMENLNSLSLSVEGFDSLSNEFKKISTLPNLKDLQLRYVKFNENELRSFNNFTKLERLGFFNFEITRLQDLFDNLSSKSKIKQLHLENLVTEESPVDYSNLMELEQLQVSVRDKSFQPLGNFFDLKALKSLRITSNEHLIKISEELGNLEALEELELSYNNLEHLPGTIGKLKNLRELRIRNNGLKQFPEEICHLTNLEVLEADNNKIIDLPREIGKLTRLKIISLNQNLLQVLPGSITDLVELEELNLGTNDLRELPADIGSLKRLKAFPLNENFLRVLPASFTHLRNLKELRLTSNTLETLPADIGNMRSLREVYLGNEKKSQITNYSASGFVVDSSRSERGRNKIKTLPPSFSKLENLERIYLSYLPTLNKMNLFEVLFNLDAERYRVDLQNVGISDLPVTGWKNFKGAKLYMGGNVVQSIPEEIIHAPYLNTLSFKLDKEDGLSYSFGNREQLLAFFEEKGFIPFDSLPKNQELAKAYLENSYRRQYTENSEAILGLMEKAFAIDSVYTAENIREDDYAKALLNSKRYPEAIEFFTNAIERDTAQKIRILNFIIPQFQNRAKAYLAVGDTLAALKDMEVVSEKFSANEWGDAGLLARKINNDSLASYYFNKGENHYIRQIDWNNENDRIDYGMHLSLLELYIISNEPDLSRRYYNELREEDITRERDKILLDYLGLIIEIIEGKAVPLNIEDFKATILNSNTSMAGWSFELLKNWIEQSDLEGSKKEEIKRITEFLQ